MRQFIYKNLDELQADAEARTQYVRFEADSAKMKAALGKKVAIGNRLTLGNAMAIHPMEGCDSTPDGRPDELTIRRYERFATGGCKLIWLKPRQSGRMAVPTQGNFGFIQAT